MTSAAQRMEPQSAMPELAPETSSTVEDGGAGGRGWQRWALAGICVLAAVLYCWSLGSLGWGNGYYSAAVKSMSRSLTNFLFGSFDPAGVITVDKPPMALWPQVISTWIFGYHGWSVLLPQAVEGVAAVFLLHRTVRRWAGENAALIAALVLAITPITVAINRDNNPDTLLVLLLVAAAYAFTRSVDPRASAGSSTRWLLLSAFFIGCGFVTKMMQAWIVLPVFALAYFVSSPRSVSRRLADLGGAAVVAGVASLWWVALVDLWPSPKPFIGGSKDGSAWDLVIGYNGLGRIFGQGGGGGGGMRTVGPGVTGQIPEGAMPVPGGGVPEGAVANPGGPGGGGGFGGESGVGRMFNTVVGGQISWLLPLALLVLVTVTVAGMFRWQERLPADRPQRAGWVLWGGWLLLTGAVFSFAQGIFHPYYTTMLAPAIAALTGAGMVRLWRDFRAPTGHGWLVLPVGVALTAVWAWVLISRDTSWHGWLRYAVAGVGVLAVVGLLVARLGRARLGGGGLARAGTVFGLVTVLLAPGVWSTATALGAGSRMGGSNPLAGPGTGGPMAAPMMSGLPGADGYGMAGDGRRGAGQGNQPGQQPGQTQPGQTQPGQSQQDGQGQPRLVIVGGGGGGEAKLTDEQRKILDYVTKNSGDAEIKLAIDTGAMGAAAWIINTDETIIGMGGFSSQDEAPTVDQLEQWVRDGRLKYVLASGSTAAQVAPGNSTQTGEPGQGRLPGADSGMAAQRAQWIQQHCTAVDPSAYGGTPVDQQQQQQQQQSQGGPMRGGPGGGAQTLYECRA